MREIVVISGKGGTGKTSLTASFAYLEKENAIVADCDVDAANMHLLLGAQFEKQEDFYSGEVAFIHTENCIDCGICASSCKFDAIHYDGDAYVVDTISCEGCWYCSRVCPKDTIEMKTQKSGDFYISSISTGSKMAHAKLGFGAENSGKLVAKVKNEAKKLALLEEKDYLIIDGSPGIGCPVISSLSGAHLVVLVTEATTSGLHDLKRVHQVVKSFGINSVCIINKFDLNEKITKEIEKYLNVENIKLVSKLPYDETFTKAMSEAKCIVAYEESKLATEIKNSWKLIKEEAK
jgi:MinD superfamily P-loop ATPase